MPPAKFPFGKEFQVKILSLMFHDFEFLVFVQDLISPSYFSDMVMGWFCTTIRDYYLDYQMRIDEVSLRNEMKKAVERKQIKAQEVQAYYKCYKAVVIQYLGKEYVVDELVTFCKHQAIKKAAIEGAELLNQNNFGAIEDIWKAALLVGESTTDMGTQYFASWPERLSNRATRREELTIPTGITGLDTGIGGGLKPGQLGIWMAPTNRGKCHSFGTLIIKYDGSFVKVEDVNVGDYLMGPDGSSRKVLGTTQGNAPMYKIIPKRGGEPFECNIDHILTLYVKQIDKVVDVPLEEYFGWSKDRKRLSRLIRSSGVEFPKHETPVSVDPWLLGMWYADGTKNLESINITNPDKAVHDNILYCAKMEGLSVNTKWTEGKTCPTLVIIGNKINDQNSLLNRIRTLYRKGECLPDRYLRGTRQERMEFLSGWIDGDGYCGNSGRIDLVQKNKQWAEDIAFLARSLGFMVSLNEKLVRLPGWEEPRSYWRLTIVGDTSEFPLVLKRKHCHPKKQWNRVGFRVEPSGRSEYAGFELDGDSRYLLRDFTVTHNSVALVHCGKRAVIMRKKVIHYTMELSEDDVSERYDSSFSKIFISKLLEEEAELARKLEDLGQRMGNSLIVKGYPTKAASINTIRAHVQQCMAMGFNPDLILIDYLDLLKSTTSRKEKREELTDITEEMRGLFGELGIPGWTATQARRSAISKDTHDEEDVAEDIGKMNIADVVVTINQTKAEAADKDEPGKMRLYLAKNRNGPKAITIPITTELGRMSFYNPGKGEEKDSNAGAHNKGRKTPPPGKAKAKKKNPPPMGGPAVS